MPYVHLLASYLKPRDSMRKNSVAAMRDLAAAWEVTAALQKHGYALGSLKLNYPPPVGDEPKLLMIETSDLGAKDLLLTATRRPISDPEQGERKSVPKGFTSLELETDAVWPLYFKILSRGRAKLRSWLHPHLPTGREDRRDIYFLQSERSDYTSLNACDGSGRRKFRGSGRTAAFVLNQPELWPGGPTYLGFFGMDAASTLAWACLLRRRHSDLLLRPGLHMVELQSAPIPERVPDLGWALDWKAELLFSVPPTTPTARPAKVGPRKISGEAQMDPQMA